MKFKVCKSMKQPHDISLESAIDSMDEGDVEVLIKEIFVVETLVVVIMNFNKVFRVDYVETLNVLKGMGSHSIIQRI